LNEGCGQQTVVATPLAGLIDNTVCTALGTSGKHAAIEFANVITKIINGNSDGNILIVIKKS